MAQSVWKRIHYIFDILDQKTAFVVGTLEVDANGYYEAENEVDAWLDGYPTSMMGDYTRRDNRPPAPQRWSVHR